VFSLVMDPTNPKILYSGNAGSIFKSTDSGRSWLPADNGMGRGYVSTSALALKPAQP